MSVEHRMDHQEKVTYQSSIYPGCRVHIRCKLWIHGVWDLHGLNAHAVALLIPRHVLESAHFVVGHHRSLVNCTMLMTSYAQTQTRSNGLVFMGHSNHATQCDHVQNVCTSLMHLRVLMPWNKKFWSSKMSTEVYYLFCV